ncbi:3-oxoacyl-(acyl-carrier-protein) synthase 2 [Denitrovibrio acetiphilus DSM 12809]|uniref:3-oxoacyl-[acyl-carrier-protein] synthase 2 n=1 Tax=Denitrovibrio acetiphilus (strain DSM 12809 / NBRC 114555 / N2460) TaxID=522772 RepID=D4H759_DENA2|nr:beta-ketoacyl-ACP synthase II [Denitrovibrio acetiphilus]ADD69763.1 3-oxoacyl-(acyl-carrier-protein) synthase 2 [Denitrovibrio acetiphilus DSM 12809]
MKKRVVVTGYGLITPIGIGNEENWNSLVNGITGIDYIPADRLDTENLPVKFAGMIKDLDVSKYVDPKSVKRHERFVTYAIVASQMALNMAEFDAEKFDLDRCGTCVGSGIGGFQAIEETTRAYDAKGVKKISPFFIPTSIINMASGGVSIQFGFKGPNLSIVTACTTGTHSVGEAARIIQRGDADVMLAGGTESSITALAIGGFSNMRALSKRNDDPKAASRPFDKDRDGFVMGEGCGIMLLESLEHAQARGAKIYGEFAGYGSSADAYHMTAPDETGDGAKRSMRAAIKDAGIELSEVDYINAHGTSTPFNDRGESIAISEVFGEHADKLKISSTKSMTGHLLGAAGSVEGIYCCMAIEKGIVPPTINLDNQDPDCPLDYVPNKAQKLDVKYALSNSFGFGGTNGTLIFKRYE